MYMYTLSAQFGVSCRPGYLLTNPFSKETHPPRIPWVREHSGPLETHLATHHIHSCSRWLWCKICRWGTCKAPHWVHKRKIQTCQGLDRQPLLWNKIDMKLQQANTVNFYAGVHQKQPLKYKHKICRWGACKAPHWVHKSKIQTCQGLDRQPLLWNKIDMKLQQANTVDFHAGVHQKQPLKYKHIISPRPEHCSYSPKPKKYGSEAQSPLPLDTSQKLNEKEIKVVQKLWVASCIIRGQWAGPCSCLSVQLQVSKQKELSAWWGKQCNYLISTLQLTLMPKFFSKCPAWSWMSTPMRCTKQNQNPTVEHAGIFSSGGYTKRGNPSG